MLNLITKRGEDYGNVVCNDVDAYINTHQASENPGELLLS